MKYDVESKVYPMMSNADKVTMCIGPECAWHHKINGEGYCSQRLNTVGVLSLGEFLYDFLSDRPIAIPLPDDSKVKQLVVDLLKKVINENDN